MIKMLIIAVCVMMFIQGFVEIGPSHQGGDGVHIDMYAYICYNHYSKIINNYCLNWWVFFI